MDVGTFLLMLGLSYALGLFWYDLLPSKLPEQVWRVAAYPFLGIFVAEALLPSVLPFDPKFWQSPSPHRGDRLAGGGGRRLGHPPGAAPVPGPGARGTGSRGVNRRCSGAPSSLPSDRARSWPGPATAQCHTTSSRMSVVALAVVKEQEHGHGHSWRRVTGGPPVRDRVPGRAGCAVPSDDQRGGTPLAGRLR